MLTDDTLKALIEAIIYVSPEPVSLDAISKAVEGEPRDRVKAKLLELMNDYAWPQRGIHIREVAGGYQFSSKAEHHEVLRGFVKSLKPPLKLSRPALETLAVIAYRQPVTVPEINEIRGVDSSGVIHTLMERKLIVTGGRKNVVGRPILYRTSRDFLIHFGLSDVGELPSLKEFEELARQALGPELFAAETPSTAAAGAQTGTDPAVPSPTDSETAAVEENSSASELDPGEPEAAPPDKQDS